jgi:hypothetical protein
MKEKSIEIKLDELGFRTGSISEVILTTMNPDGTPNAAPMGALRTGPGALEIRPFKTSSTYRNLLGHKTLPRDGLQKRSLRGVPGGIV